VSGRGPTVGRGASAGGPSSSLAGLKYLGGAGGQVQGRGAGLAPPRPPPPA